MTFHKNIKIWLPLLLSCGSFFLSFGQANWAVFNEVNSALPNNTIRCLLVDHQNHLWVGTDNGLAQFDGENWQVYSSSNSPLADNYIRALAVDNSNNLYIGTTLNGIYKFDGVNWLSINTSNSAIPDNFIRTITIDQQQRMWVGTVEGFACLDQGNWTTWNSANAGLLSNNITSIACTPATQYVGTINGGLIYLSNQVITNYTLLSSGVPDNSVISVQLDQLNRPWFGSTAQGIFTDNGNQTWLSFNVLNSPLPSNSITAFELDGNDNFLIGTHQDGFVLRENNSDWFHYNTDNSPLPDNHILSCTRDSNQVIWIGTNNFGLVKLWTSQASIDEVEKSAVHVYPNPINIGSKLNWNFKDNFTEIRMHSLTGELIWSSNLEPGQSNIEFPILHSSLVLVEWLSDRDRIKKLVQVIH